VGITGTHSDNSASGELSREECDRLLQKLTGYDSHLPWACLPALFERQARLTPDAPAVKFNRIHLTYRELDTAADRLASQLIALGAGPERLVGVGLNRSAHLVVSLLAVLKAGAAYLPLDPEYPEHRISLMLADAAPVCVVTTSDLVKCWKSSAWNGEAQENPTSSAPNSYHDSIVWLTLDETDSLTAEPKSAPIDRGSSPWNGLHPLNPAYSIYTSGSTGAPKGVVVPHAAIVNRLLWMQSYYGIGSGDRILQKTPFNFDVSVWEFFWPLITGATLVIAKPDGHRDPAYLAEIIRNEQITTVHFVPSMLALFLAEPAATLCTSLRRVICSGEALSPDLEARYLVTLDAPLFNLYGPTEVAVDSTFWECRREGLRHDTVPIGYPITNVQAYVLRDDLTPTRPGEAGELYLAGTGLARGYLNRPSLTGQRFVPDPFGPPSARMYRTGDRACQNAQGALEYLGRTDDQVKIHGIRIEPGEIEAALCAFPGSQAAAIAVHGEQITGYIVPDRNGSAEHDLGGRSPLDRTSSWREVFDARYEELSADSEFDIRGWISSIDGEDMSAVDIRQWRDLTIARLRESEPRRILEIGCGSGLLAVELISDCTEYVGTDFAGAELHRLQKRLDSLAPGKARLLLLEANQTAQLGGSFDLVVINSVIQYFPDSSYLVEVLKQAIAQCAPGGVLFIGDVRHRGLARLLYAEQAVARHPGSTREEIQLEAEMMERSESELLVDPAFFLAFSQRLGIGSGSVSVRPKPGRYDNELSRYRYDVLIRVSNPPETLVGTPEHDWGAGGLAMPDLVRMLEAGLPGLILRGVPNARLRDAVALLAPADAARLSWLHPEDLTSLAASYGYHVRLDWAAGSVDGSYSAALYRDGPAPEISRNAPDSDDPAAFTNRPLAARETLPPTHRIWTYLRDRLPSALVPASIVVLQTLPLTSSGKLDRKALAPAVALTSGGGPAPQTRAEKVLCGLFANALGVRTVGIDDSFFELGGDSILAIQVIGRARAAGFAFTLRDVFRYRTVREICSVIVSTQPDQYLRTADDLGELPLTPVAHWCAERGEPIDGYSQWVLIQTPPGLTDSKLNALLQALLDGHDALRTRLVREDAGSSGSWQLEIVPRGTIRAEHLTTRIEAAELAPHLTEERLASYAAAAADELRPGAAENFRAVWLDAGRECAGRLLWVIHHMVVDGISWRILLADLVAGWRQISAAETVECPKYTTAMRSWSRSLRDASLQSHRVTELDTWMRVLQTPDPVLGAAALDSRLDLMRTVASAEFSLDSAITEALLHVPARFGAEVNDVLLSALAMAVATYRRQKNVSENSAVLLSLEGHGREDIQDGIDISRTVGWFTSIFPVRIDPGLPPGSAQSEWTDDSVRWAQGAVQQVGKDLRSLKDRGIGYGLLRYLNEYTRGELSRFATPQISFNYLGRFPMTGGSDWQLAAECHALHDYAPPDLPAAYALEIQALTEEHSDGACFIATFSWPVRLFARSDVETIGELWLKALRMFAECATYTEPPNLTPADFRLVPSLDQDQLQLLAAEIDGAGGRTPSLGESMIEDILPLSPLQQGLLFHTEFNEDNPDVYMVQAVVDLDGLEEPAALRTACAALLNRHDALRASFHYRELDCPVQVIHRTTLPRWHAIDLSGLAGTDQETETQRFLDVDRAERFDLTRPPLRFTLLNLGSGSYRLVLTHHHILLDGWSLTVLVKDLLAICSGKPMPAIPPYRDYLAWLAAWDKAPAKTAWNRILDSLPNPAPVAPVGYTMEGPPSPRSIRFDMSVSATEALTAQARARSVTLHSVAASLWGVLIGHMTGQTDVVFGTAVSGRPPEIAGIDGMAGLFANSVPIRVRWSGEDSAVTLVERIQQDQASLFEFQSLGLGEIQRAVRRRRLFDTFFQIENYPGTKTSSGATGSLPVGPRVTRFHVIDATHYPLGMLITPDKQLQIRLEYQEAAFSPEQVEEIGRRYLELLDAFTVQPDVCLSCLLPPSITPR